MRHWIIFKNLGKVKLGSDYEGHLARIFIDTCANCNSITRRFYSILLDQGLKCAFYPGPSGVEIDLVCGLRLGVSGDKTMFMTEVKITWGTFHSEQEFLIMDQDGEDLVSHLV